MFSGLNRLIKIILPKRLFYRALIIVAAPTIILQVIITIVFYDSIWIKANKNITRSLVAQLKTIEEMYQNDKKNIDFFTDSNRNNFNYGDFVMLISESDKLFDFVKFNNTENKMNEIFGIVVKNPGIENNNENCIYLIKKGIALLSLCSTKNIKLGSSLVSSFKGKTNKCCVNSLENILLKKSEENSKREYYQFIGKSLTNIINKNFILVELDLRLLLV